MSVELNNKDAAQIGRFLAKDALWSQSDIMAWLGCSRSTVTRLVASPGFPEAILVGGLIRYKAQSVKTFVEHRAA